MSFCNFSSQYVISNQTEVDNIFINDYLPYAPESCVKVYLYGLYKCHSASTYDNTLTHFSKVLNLSEEDVESAFLYWQEQGLVQVIYTPEIEIKYMPVHNSINNIKKYSKEKYKNFNLAAQEIITGRMITPNEYAEYYTVIEAFHVEAEALIMIMKYCTNLKGANVNHSYITTVAKNWAYEGITTTGAVEDKLNTFELLTSEIGTLFKVLSIRRAPNIEERELFNKWTNTLDYNLDVLKYIAKEVKKKPHPSFEKMDSLITKYYSMRLMTIKEIEEYEQNKNELYNLAKKINKIIGVYYENLETVVENYIAKWKACGFSDGALEKIANYCFRNSIRSLEGMNNNVQKFFKLGILTEESMDDYLAGIIAYDKQIKKILELLGENRLVNSWDRNFYKTWSSVWNLSDEIIEFAATKACGKVQPMQYINKILATFNDKGVKTVEQAKNLEIPQENKIKNVTSGKSYSKEDMNALFDSLDEIEI